MNELRQVVLYGLASAFPIVALATYIQFRFPPDALHTAHYGFLVVFPLALASLPWGFLVAIINAYIGLSSNDTVLFGLIVFSVCVNGIWISYATKDQRGRTLFLLLFATISSTPLVLFLRHA